MSIWKTLILPWWHLSMVFLCSWRCPDSCSGPGPGWWWCCWPTPRWWRSQRPCDSSCPSDPFLKIFRFIRLNSMFLWKSHNITQFSFQSFFFSISECWYIFLVLIQSEFTDLSRISKHKLEIYPRCMPMKHEPIVKHSNRFCIIWM